MFCRHKHLNYATQTGSEIDGINRHHLYMTAKCKSCNKEFKIKAHAVDSGKHNSAVYELQCKIHELQKKLQAANETIDSYASHYDWCDTIQSTMKCNCGFNSCK